MSFNLFGIGFAGENAQRKSRWPSGYFKAEVKKSAKSPLNEEFLKHPLSSISSRRILGCKGRTLNDFVFKSSQLFVIKCGDLW